MATLDGQVLLPLSRGALAGDEFFVPVEETFEARRRRGRAAPQPSAPALFALIDQPIV
jgi:hypothetical protein